MAVFFFFFSFLLKSRAISVKSQNLDFFNAEGLGAGLRSKTKGLSKGFFFLMKKKENV
jgi:hypothetical protein